MAGKTLTKRLVARIVVSLLGVIVALFYFLEVVTAPIFPYPQQQWANVARLVLVGLGLLIFYWAAFTNFDRSKDEKFFG